jgi:lipoate---protein ligase
MRHEEKISGGKMLAVEAEVSGQAITRVKITGDFFLHPEDALLALEKSLTGINAGTGEDEMESIAAKSLEGANLIGASAKDIARILKKAVS